MYLVWNKQLKLELELYKLFNTRDETADWMDLNVQQNFNNRNQNVQIVDYSKLKVGKNILVNRLTIIDLDLD